MEEGNESGEDGRWQMPEAELEQDLDEALEFDEEEGHAEEDMPELPPAAEPQLQQPATAVEDPTLPPHAMEASPPFKSTTMLYPGTPNTLCCRD